MSLHCSEIFGLENLEIMERVHNSFLRRITKAGKSTLMYIIYGEFGRFHLSVLIKDQSQNLRHQYLKIIPGNQR